MLDGGEINQARQLLGQAVRRFPDNDMINALYGQALYESRLLDQSEKYFMKALRLNADNIRAQKYIKQIRDIRASTTSEEAQEWQSVVKDKIGDLVVFVLSIWLGTSINSFYRIMMRTYRWRQAKKNYIQKRYKEVVRILESHVIDMDQDAIDQCLEFMLAHSKKKEKVRGILERFVIRESDLKVLTRSLDLLADEQHAHHNTEVLES